MHLAQREHDGVFGGRGLQLKIERFAKPLAQGQAKSSIEAAAQRTMQHHLHAASAVKKALRHQQLIRRHGAQGMLGCVQVAYQLRHGVGRQRWILAQPSHNALRIAQVQSHLPAQGAHLRRQLMGARRRLARPRGNARRRLARILHLHGALAHRQDAPVHGAQNKNVAFVAVDRKVFRHLPHGELLRHEHHAKVARVGDGAAAGERRQLRAFAGAHLLVHLIHMHQSAPAAPAGGVAVGHHGQHVVKCCVRQLVVGVGPLRPGSQCGDGRGHVAQGAHPGHQLLGQNIQGLLGDL